MDSITKSLDAVVDLLQSKINQRGNPVENILPNVQKLISDTKNDILHLLFNRNAEAKDTIIRKKELYSKVLVKSGKANDDPKVRLEFLEKIDKTLLDKKIDASIIGTSTTSKGDVLIKFKETQNIKEIVREIETSDKTTFENKISTLKPILPKISITNIPEYYDLNNLDSFKNKVIQNNQTLAEKLSDNNSIFEPLFKYSNKKKSQTVVIKCSPDIRSIIKLNNEEIKLNNIVCKVFDHFHLKICTNCCKIGHVKNNCHSKTTKCTFCSEEHNFKNCPVKNDKSKYSCANCKHGNNTSSSNHSCFSSNCPHVIKTKQMILKNTQYNEINHSQL